MVLVLHVAEKPSICSAVAVALARGQDLGQRGRSPPVYEFEGEPFQGHAHVTTRVTSVVGHVFSTDFPAAFQNWDQTDPAELFDAPVLSTAQSKGIVKHLEREAAGADYLVLWLDCDREGENICFEVIRCVEGVMRNGANYTSGKDQTVFRARFSAVTERDIHAAMQALVAPNENESRAVECRQELDLKVGVAFTRFQVGPLLVCAEGLPTSLLRRPAAAPNKQLTSSPSPSPFTDAILSGALRRLGLVRHQLRSLPNTHAGLCSRPPGRNQRISARAVLEAVCCGRPRPRQLCTGPGLGPRPAVRPGRRRGLSAPRGRGRRVGLHGRERARDEAEAARTAQHGAAAQVGVFPPGHWPTRRYARGRVALSGRLPKLPSNRVNSLPALFRRAASVGRARRRCSSRRLRWRIAARRSHPSA